MGGGKTASVSPDLGKRLEIIESWAAIVALPNKQREVLLLSMEGLSITEISDVVQVKEDTVRSTLSRARKQVRRSIGTADEQRQSARGRKPVVGDASTGRSSS